MSTEPPSEPPRRQVAAQEDMLRALTPLLREAEGSAVSAASGGSMGEPFASATEVRIELGGKVSPVEGDIVAVADGNRLVLHRVLAVGTGAGHGYIMTMGDARRFPDPPVHLDRVVGRVSALRIRDRWEPIPSASGRTRAASTALLRAAFRRSVPASALLMRLLRDGEMLVRRSRSRLGAGMRRLLRRDQSGTGLG